MNCHNGALLSDGDYHHLGTSFYAKDNFRAAMRSAAKPRTWVSSARHRSVA